jgi:hypothetical protein
MQAPGRRPVRDGTAAVVVLVGVAVSQAGMASGIGTSRAEPPPSGITAVDPNLAGVNGPQAEGATAMGNTPGFTANALVSANPASVARPQVEPSVASEPSSRNVMVAGYADAVADLVPGVSRSIDGGKSWSAPTGGPLLPNPPGLIWGNRATVGHLAGGDSAVAWGTGETVYFSTLGFQDNSNPPAAGVCNVGGIYVYRSSDGGNTWALPAGGAAVPNTQTVFRDKEYIAVDDNPASSRAGTVYMVWDDDQYAGCPQNFGTNFVTRRIMFSRSTDSGAAWSAPAALASGCLVAPIPAVGADGSLYVSWFDCNSGDRELVRKSTDGGVTFSAAVAAGSGLVRCPNPLPGASFRVNAALPVIAADPTDAARVYVAWSSCTATAQADVFFSRSSDGGATWSPTPLRVNDDGASNPRDQFFPWITVDDFGVVRAMWGDDRLDLVNPGGHNYDIFGAASTDQGASFGTNVRVTPQSSNPDIDNGGTFIGDYFGLAPCGTPVWGDTRNGNQDIFGAGLDEAATGVFPFCTKTNQTIAFGALVNKTYGDADFSVSATASSGLPVSFAASGSCTVSSATVHLTGPGSCTVTASQAGDSTYNAAAAVPQTFSIASRPTPPTRCIVPNVVGKRLGAAKLTIERRHCRTGKVGHAYSRKRKKGIVISQSRRPGRVVPANSKINLVVSRGRKP